MLLCNYTEQRQTRRLPVLNSVKYENQYGAGSTYTGVAAYVTDNSDRHNQVFFIDMYPQFIKERDTEVAASIYFGFDGYGYNGVKSWNATRTVPYATHD